MSEPIIIETPAPPTRERLVLVAASGPSETEIQAAKLAYCNTFGATLTEGLRAALVSYGGKDATPADLERGGWVPVLHGAASWKAAHADASAELAKARAALAAQPDPGTLAHLRADLRDAVKRAEHAEAFAGDVSRSEPRMSGRLVSVMLDECEDLEALEQAHDAHMKSREGLSLATQMAKLSARAEKAERERDDLLEGDMREARTQRERADTAEAERDTLRAEVARLTAPGEGELTPSQILDACPPAGGIERLLACYRLGVAHERARQQPAKDRATDEELGQVYRVAYRAAPREIAESAAVDMGIRAVAARVRQERCLVAQAVALKAGVSFWYCDAGWAVNVGGHTVPRLPPSEVPATLARLLGEVAR